jgi:hypothetical protein
MGQTRKNLLSYRSKYISQIVLTKDLIDLIYKTMKVKQIIIKGVKLC